MKRFLAIVLCLILTSGCNITIHLPSDTEDVNVEDVEVVDEPVDFPEEQTSDTGFSVYGKVIVIDPGHGVTSTVKKEAIAPGSTEMKNAFVSGTAGKNQTEEELNLKVSDKLKTLLEERGAEIYMTRTTHECEVSNIDRAEFANSLNADISVKIHADGLDNKSVKGVSVLVPGNQYISDKALLNESHRAGECILESFVLKTGAKNRGISVRNDMTGFNWSKVPVVLVELGFMTNPEEDALMETEDYQDKMVLGIADGLEEYFSGKPTAE